MERFKPNDLVIHATAPGVRGTVLGYSGNRGQVMVCWETGYEPYTLHWEKDLEPANVLDLLVDPREIVYRHEPTYSRCGCGRKLVLKHRAPFCTACNSYYAIRRQETQDEPEDVHRDRRGSH